MRAAAPLAADARALAVDVAVDLIADPHVKEVAAREAVGVDLAADVEGARPFGAHAEGLRVVLEPELDRIAAVDRGADRLEVGVAVVIRALRVRERDLPNGQALGLVAVLGLPVGRDRLDEQLLLGAGHRHVGHVLRT